MFPDRASESGTGRRSSLVDPELTDRFNDDFIRYGEPLLLKLSGRAVSGEDSSGLVFRSEALEALYYACDGCRCMPERWSGFGSVTLHSTLSLHDGSPTGDVGRRVRVGDQLFISTNQRWELTREERWGIRGRHYSMLDQGSYVASDKSTIPTPFMISTPTAVDDMYRQGGSTYILIIFSCQPASHSQIISSYFVFSDLHYF